MSSPATDVPAPHLQIRFDEKVPILAIPAQMEFDALRDWLRERIPDQEAVIGGRTSRMDLGDREIKLFDLRRLLHFLREEYAIEITGIYVHPGAIHRYAERELKLKLFPIVHLAGDTTEVHLVDEDVVDTLEAVLDDDLLDAPEAPILDKITLPNDLEIEDLEEGPKGLPNPTHSESGKRTLTLNRTLRSGAVVRFDGDIFVFGDVNPGAHIIATGNITVLGALKGLVHAGAAGVDEACIMALTLRPTQLRIGRKIAIPPDRTADTTLQPEMAAVIDGKIVIEPYMGKLRNQ